MSRRRVTPTVGATAGALLGAALVPCAVAIADGDYGSYSFVGSTPEMVSVGGERDVFVSVPPAAEGSVQGSQALDVLDSNSSPVGTIDALVANNTDLLANTNQTLIVTGGSGDVPSTGSVFDTFTYTGGIASIYSDIVGAGPGGTNLISYTWETPLGSIDIPTTFDAAASIPVDQSLPGGISYLLDGPENLYGIAGIVPAASDIQGYQSFDVTDATGVIGHFNADVTNTSDILDNGTQEFLVTASSGDAPAVGSVYNTFFLPGGIENIYSAVPQADGTDLVTDTLTTPYGDYTIPFTIPFDAANGLANVLAGGPLGMEIAVPGDFDIIPDALSPGTIVAIDGLPPEDVVIQGSQVFNETGSQIGQFEADVSQSSIIFSNTTLEQLVVTQDLSGSAPAAGSVFETFNFAPGLSIVYSDVVSATAGGPNTITDTVVTPFGNVLMPNLFDAAAVLAADSSQHFPELANLFSGGI